MQNYYVYCLVYENDSSAWQGPLLLNIRATERKQLALFQLSKGCLEKKIPRRPRKQRPKTKTPINKTNI